MPLSKSVGYSYTLDACKQVGQKNYVGLPRAEKQELYTMPSQVSSTEYFDTTAKPI